MKYLIFIVCILTGCSTKPTTNGSTSSENDSVKINKKDLIVIDITKHPEKTINLEEIANVEYIPLETNDSTFVNLALPDVVSDKYIVYHNKNGQVLVFNRKGKRLYSFNRRGGGPEEYSAILDIILDEKEEELYIEDICIAKIYVYSINGKFKRKLALPKNFFPACLTNYDKDYLFCYNDFMGMNENMQKNKLSQEDIKNRDNPYFFISKQTGEIIPFNYAIPNRMDNQAFEIKNGKITGIQMMKIYPLSHNTPDIMITEFADDTLYYLKEKKLVPIIIKKPSTHRMDPPTMLAVDLFTDRYIFILAYKKRFDGDRMSGIYIVYDKQVDEFYQLRSNLPISIPMKENYISLPHNTGITSKRAEYLLQDYNDGKLEGKLKEIASKLKEDDNPVLILIKFKE